MDKNMYMKVLKNSKCKISDCNYEDFIKTGFNRY